MAISPGTIGKGRGILQALVSTERLIHSSAAMIVTDDSATGGAHPHRGSVPGRIRPSRLFIEEGGWPRPATGAVVDLSGHLFATFRSGSSGTHFCMILMQLIIGWKNPTSTPKLKRSWRRQNTFGA